MYICAYCVQVHVPSVLYNAIHEVITLGRGCPIVVSFGSNIDNTKVHVCEVRLDVGQRSEVNFGIYYHVDYCAYST